MTELKKIDFEVWCRFCNTKLDFEVDDYDELIKVEPCPYCTKDYYIENVAYKEEEAYDQGYDQGHQDGYAEGFGNAKNEYERGWDAAFAAQELKK